MGWMEHALNRAWLEWNQPRACLSCRPSIAFPAPVSVTLDVMPLLLLPLFVILLVAILVVALPLSLRMRYRQGRARRRAFGWLLRFNAWALLSSVPVFLVMAWLGTHWSVDALQDASLGLVVGVALGGCGLLLTRFERVEGRLHYTPNRWLVLALTWLVALRIVIGVWATWRRATGSVGVDTGWAHVVDAGGLWAMGGVLLGYATAYAWGLHRRRAALGP